MPPSNCTYYCEPCDRVAKGSATCTCGQPMRNMGKNWKPGRKGHRNRMFDQRLSPRMPWGFSQLPFEPPRKTGRKRARAGREAVPVVPRHHRILFWWEREIPQNGGWEFTR